MLCEQLSLFPTLARNSQVIFDDLGLTTAALALGPTTEVQRDLSKRAESVRLVSDLFWFVGSLLQGKEA